MWYITSQKNGVSALGLQRVLGLGSYRTAWLMLHKLRQAIVRPGREKLSGVLEVDETYWGSAEFGGATGRKTLSKVLIIVAAEADGKRIGRIRMALIEDFDRKTLHRFIEDNIELGSMVCTDGLNSYRELNGYIHNRKVQNLRQGGEPLLPRVHLVISLLKRWLLGTLQGSASDKYSMITSMNSCFALIDGDLPHAESFSIVWLNRPSTPNRRHTRSSQAGGFSAWWSQVHTQKQSSHCCGAPLAGALEQHR